MADLKILLADDDPVGRRLAALMIARLGCKTPATVENGRAAADAVFAQQYDVLLMDLEMPGLNGCAAAREIVQRPGARPWLIAMSAPDAAAASDWRQAGFDDHLSKPLNRSALASALARAVTRGAAPADDFNPAAWAELLRVFRQSGVAELIAVLAADVPEQQQRYKAAAQTGDLDALRRLAHTLRGTSLQLGAASLAERCTQAEHSATAGEAEPARTLLAEIVGRHAALVERLRREAGAA